MPQTSPCVNGKRSRKTTSGTRPAVQAARASFHGCASGSRSAETTRSHHAHVGRDSFVRAVSPTPRTTDLASQGTIACPAVACAGVNRGSPEPSGLITASPTGNLLPLHRFHKPLHQSPPDSCLEYCPAVFMSDLTTDPRIGRTVPPRELNRDFLKSWA